MQSEKYLPKGGRPPATDGEDLRILRGSNDAESLSRALLPLPLDFVRLCNNATEKHSTTRPYMTHSYMLSELHSSSMLELNLIGQNYK